MRTAQDIILKPIITEESMMGIMTKKYTFKVAKMQTKSKSLRLLNLFSLAQRLLR